MTGWTLWRRWWKVQLSTPSRISHPLGLSLSLSLSLSPFHPCEPAYLPTNALSWSLVGDGQLLMYVILQRWCVRCMFMDWGASQSNWSCSVKVHGDLWRLKAENTGGWKDDGPRWGNNFAVGLILFDLYCYERNIMERNGLESMFVVLWSNIYGVGYKWKKPRRWNNQHWSWNWTGKTDFCLTSASISQLQLFFFQLLDFLILWWLIFDQLIGCLINKLWENCLILITITHWPRFCPPTNTNILFSISKIKNIIIKM